MTSFTVTRDGPLWLMLRHERLGVTSWELPGGNADPGETLEQPGRPRDVRGNQCQGRGRPAFGIVRARVARTAPAQTHLLLRSEAATDEAPAVPPSEAQLVEAAWMSPLDVDDVSACLLPLIEQERRDWADAPVHFQMTHRLNDLGHWEPSPVPRRG